MNASEHEGPSPEYIFAHYALRQVALSSPLPFLAMAASPDGPRFIERLLADVGQQCGRAAKFEASEVQLHPTLANGYPCAVVELPEPEEITEAFMVGLVALVDRNQNPSPDPETVAGRFFTLEKGFHMSGEPRTVLAEWETSTHLNYGDGPAPNVADFIAAISEKV